MIRRLLVVAGIVALSSSASAVPITLTHEGRLLDGSDNPVNQAQLRVSFSIWTNALATDPEFRAFPASGEFSCTADVVHGFYALVFGGTGDGACGAGLSSDVFPFGQVRYLEVSIGGMKLSPRMRIATVPTAAVAATALDAEKVGGKTLSDLDARYVQATGAAFVALQGATPSAQQGAISVTGPVTGASFAGDGSRLTALDPTTLSAPIPGSLVKGSYGEQVAFGHMSNTFSGTFDGTHTGNGRGLAEIDAQKLGGRLDSAYALKTDLAPLALKTDLSPYALKADLEGYLPKAGTGSVQLGGGIAGTCDGTAAGTVRWNGTNFEGCNGTKWVRLDNTPAPVVTQVSPASGPFEGGTSISLTGDNFEAPVKVFVGGVEATSVVFVNAGAITAVTPLAQKGGANDVRVQVGSGASGLASAAFSYGAPGQVRAAALANCKALKAAGATTDGAYYVDTNGGATTDAVLVYCDMTTDGGGWTLAGFSQAGAGAAQKNMYSLKCGGGAYHPTNRNDSGTIASVDLARASTEVLFAQSTSTANSERFTHRGRARERASGWFAWVKRHVERARSGGVRGVTTHYGDLSQSRGASAGRERGVAQVSTAQTARAGRFGRDPVLRWKRREAQWAREARRGLPASRQASAQRGRRGVKQQSSSMEGRESVRMAPGSRQRARRRGGSDPRRAR